MLTNVIDQYVLLVSYLDDALFILPLIIQLMS